MIFGLPFASFILLLVLPGIILAIMFYHCWQINKGKRD